MESAKEQRTAEEVQVNQDPEPATTLATKTSNDDAISPEKTSKKSHKHSRSKKSKKKGKASKEESSSDSSSASEDSESESDSDSDSSSDSSEEDRHKRKARRRKERAKGKGRHKKSRKHDSSDSESEDSSSSSEDSEEEYRRRKRRRARKQRKRRASEADEAEEDELDEEVDDNDELAEILAAEQRLKALKLQRQRNKLARARSHDDDEVGGKRKGRGKKKRGRKGSKLEYKRLDQLWDSTIHNYKLTESAEDHEDEFDQYIFTVRRKFDWENKYRSTVVDIKSKILRDGLAEVMKDVKSVSLVEEQPSVDPNTLFLYLEEIRTFTKKTLKARLKKTKKRKEKKRVQQTKAQLKVMVKYLDQDYDETKKTLYPLLEAGNITFDLLWALFKPNSIAYTTTYGDTENPRCFKVDYANKESSFMRGEWYCVEGRYLEYDGKNYGLGEIDTDVDAFKGPRKITSLPVYPLQYHKDPEGLKKELVERGKHFVSLQGMNYKFHKGLAFQKKKKGVAKVNINGRVMVDPAIFRRINPNYQISSIKAEDHDDLFGGDSDSECSECAAERSDEEGGAGGGPTQDLDKDDDKQKFKYKVFTDENNEAHIVEVPVDENGNEIKPEKLTTLQKNGDVKAQSFTDEELLIASSVVLGFSFSEKLWLEFSLSGIKDIEWNEGAFNSLVLPHNQKSIVKALVQSHKFHAAETIDDVVQGKGKGLVFVLHGPPGVGKTLTGEGIAEFLKCPLYSVSAGELGTDTRFLEHELNKIMDIAHSWGAVLLLDEADVFLEKREVHDIHRNALVSIFLRLLEYFQGILFLTTNRVETFDDAFQSRIHVALRYAELSNKAKKEIWKMFLEKVRVMEGVETVGFKEADFDALARRNLNGRQIKNAVRTAQALAVNEKEKLSMDHIRRVLEVAESFARDLKGGTGYEDAMRSYT